MPQKKENGYLKATQGSVSVSRLDAFSLEKRLETTWQLQYGPYVDCVCRCGSRTGG